MKKITAIRVVSFLCAAVLVAVGFAIKAEIKSKNYKLEIQNTYSRSLEELNASVNNISIILQKARYTASPSALSSMAAKLLSEAEISKNALSQLGSEGELIVLNRFLSQVGNYALSVSKKLIDGEKLPASYSENVDALSETAKRITEIMGNAQINYNNLKYWKQEIDNKLNTGISADTLSGSFEMLEDELVDYPTLVYDGPYSDHILKKEPALLKEKPKVSRTEALKNAAKIACCNENELKFYASEQGKIPVYHFKNSALNVTVSQAGGYAVYMRKNRAVGDSVLSYEQALNKARRYMESLSFTSFVESYYFIDEGICVINFAYLDGETVCYTDLIKVGIAMDNGEVMLFEASGYIANHTERAFESTIHTADEASAVLSKDLKISETSLALIPTDSGGEVRCYEFLCTTPKQEEILVYINVLTLKQEEILILLKSDGGVLTK